METVSEAFQEGALREEGRLSLLSAGLDLQAGGGVFEAEEEGACVFEVL